MYKLSETQKEVRRLSSIGTETPEETEALLHKAREIIERYFIEKKVRKELMKEIELNELVKETALK